MSFRNGDDQKKQGTKRKREDDGLDPNESAPKHQKYQANYYQTEVKGKQSKGIKQIAEHLATSDPLDRDILKSILKEMTKTKYAQAIKNKRNIPNSLEKLEESLKKNRKRERTQDSFRKTIGLKCFDALAVHVACSQKLDREFIEFCARKIKKTVF